MAAGLNGGVAQLGEHLPCKQGVKSSNLSVSTDEGTNQKKNPYLENRILNKNQSIQSLKGKSERTARIEKEDKEKTSETSK